MKKKIQWLWLWKGWVVTNFYKNFKRLVSLASQWNCHEMPVVSSRARQEYRLKRNVTLDSTVGSCSNFYRSFRKLFCLASHLNYYSTPPASGRATPKTRQEYWLKRFVTLDLTIGSCSNFQEFQEACFLGVAMISPRDAGGVSLGQTRVPVQESKTLDPTVGSCLNFYRIFRRLFALASY